MKLPVRILALSMLLMPAAAFSQQATNQQTPIQKGAASLFKSMNDNNVFNTIEIGANIGTTGLGLELASPMTDWAKLRVGFDWMPPFKIPMSFSMDSYTDGQISDERFDKIQKTMYEMTGMTIDKDVDMESKPTMTTLRVLVDVYPFKNNRHWHFTAGFFYGGNSVGKSLNKMSEMPSLLALNMYDRMYTNITADDFIDKIIDEPIFNDIYLDPEIAMEMQEQFLSMGKLGVHVGDYKDGTPYMMMPDKDGTVSAKAIVNRFRPYVGFGYGGALTSDGKWQVSFDAGVQFWGGTPKVTTHDGTVLNDLENLRGKVGDYMDLMKAIPVYPTVDFRISYRF
ncbi:MAG: hypothetical protein J5995_01930 [Muribaculaceae bacterium]|nr:hypothetical protein [Muribaculaceae bacterium]